MHHRCVSPSCLVSRSIKPPAWFVACLALISLPWLPVRGEDAYTTEQVYNLRPNPARVKVFGHIGPTGIEAVLQVGLRLEVEEIAADSPAVGIIQKGDIILGVNGTLLKGANPFVVLGRAITEAEAQDGKLDVAIKRGEESKVVTLKIPVLGAYSDTWPVDCPKSETIIAQAAAYYHQALAEAQQARDGIPGVRDETEGIPGALMCLFLLSTGDDAHLPVIKGYFKPFMENPQGIGDHTWNNGYNGVACAEYYLRTGDKDVLPVLQYYCDNAKKRQKFGSAWTHWGLDINPRYVAGGLMNPASAQVLTTLLLAKECGVEVDDETLLGALTFFYRFVGHGTVPYGDHRSEGGIGSNGKDGMVAAAMQVAAGASSDTSIYESARDALAMSTLKSYPGLATGHGDNGRGDGIWRGLSAQYLREKKPEEYRAMMDRLTWWFDVSRFHDGALGLAAVGSFNDPGSGAGMALAYTAHLRNLRITGAPVSEHAVRFALPEHVWGRKADLQFHSLEHNQAFATFGEEMAPHRIMHLLGNAYKQTEPDVSGPEGMQILQNVYHHHYMFRSQACKALVKAGKLEKIEELLRDADPRIRRAALDGIIDWRYWFAMGKHPLQADQYTPGMINAISRMIHDPNTSLLVVEGALFAMHHMPVDVIQTHVDAILPWTEHEEWWLRHAAFMALQGLAKDPDAYVAVLPRLMDMVVSEYHTQPRDGMHGQLRQVLRQVGPDSKIGQIMLDGLMTAASKSEIKSGLRTREGAWNVLNSVRLAMASKADTADELAARLAARIGELDSGSLLEIVAVGKSGSEGFYPMLEQVEGETRERLASMLYESYLPVFVQRLKAEPGANLAVIDTVLALRKLREDVGGWKVVGSPSITNRTWRYLTLDPVKEEEKMPLRERKRFRMLTLPPQYKNWFTPAFDDRAWQSGPAPIGIGHFMRGNPDAYPTRSLWGEGEFILARTTFVVDALDYDLYRLRILNNQGFSVYLNGKRVSNYIWWNDTPRYWKRPLRDEQAALLQEGTNTLAMYANLEYPSAMKPHWKQDRFGTIDVYIEGLRKQDLY